MLYSSQTFKPPHHLSLHLQVSRWIARFWHHLKICLKVFPKCSVCIGSLQEKMGMRRRESLGRLRCHLNHLLWSTSCFDPVLSSGLARRSCSCTVAGCGLACPPRLPAKKLCGKRWWSPRGWSGPQEPSGSSRVSTVWFVFQRDGAEWCHANQRALQTSLWRTAPYCGSAPPLAGKSPASVLVSESFFLEGTPAHRWFRSLVLGGHLAVWSCSFSAENKYLWFSSSTFIGIANFPELSGCIIQRNAVTFK